jgi:predicted NodU family carbamoyl transferase
MRILGMSHAEHSACALVENGRAIAACAEERFSRIRGDLRFPRHALRWILSSGGLQLQDVDRVAFSCNPSRHMAAAPGDAPEPIARLYELPRQLLTGDADTANALGMLPYIELKLPWRRGPSRVEFISHHLCHAAHAFFVSPFAEAAIIVADASAEACEAHLPAVIARGSGSRLELLERLSRDDAEARDLVALAQRAKQLTGLDRLCLGGDRTTDGALNERVAQEGGFADCFVPPANHDAGASLGAALYTAHVLTGAPRRTDRAALHTDQLGPSFDDDELTRALERAAASYRVVDAATDLAPRLAAGRTLARFGGRAELGTLPLGNRALLSAADCAPTVDGDRGSDGTAQSIVACVLEPSCGRYFESSHPSPFGLLSYRAKEQHRASLAGVLDSEGRARVMTVDAERAPELHALLRAYAGQLARRQTPDAPGDPTARIEVLRCAPFAPPGEPPVNTPTEALRCFRATQEIDDLLLGRYAVER